MRLKVFLKDKNKKNWFKIIKELIVFAINKKELPYYYFGKFLYRKSASNYLDFLSIKQTDKIILSKELHKYEHSSILRNKLSFALYCENSGIAVPKLLSHNFGNIFYFQEQAFELKDKSHLYDFFTKVFEDTNQNRIFIKPIGDMGGTDCVLLKRENLKVLLESYGDTILKNGNVHQVAVEQHEAMSAIYPHSINTIRFDTYRDEMGNGHILSAFLRLGTGGSFVDNASSGGFYVPIDLQNGTLKKTGFQLMRYGGKKFEEHPDTHYRFNGFEIPFFKESQELILKALEYIPDGIIGWDLGISTKGPVIIEGNDNNSIFLSDVAYGGLLRHPQFKRILERA